MKIKINNSLIHSFSLYIYGAIYCILLLCIFSRSRSTVVNSYDLTTCPSWLQSPNRPRRHTTYDYPAMGGNQLVTESQAHKWVQAGLDRHRLLSQRRKKKKLTWRCRTDLPVCRIIDTFAVGVWYGWIIPNGTASFDASVFVRSTCAIR